MTTKPSALFVDGAAPGLEDGAPGDARTPARAGFTRGPTRAGALKTLFVVGAWTLIGAFDFTRDTVAYLAGVARAPSGTDLSLTLESVWLWAALTPIIFALAERFPIERATWVRRLALHGAFAIGILALDVSVDHLVVPLLAPEAARPLLRRFLGESFINLYSYFAVLGVGLALRWNRLYHERRLRVARLETELFKAKLDALEAQLRPHFLYNTLHTISALVRTGAKDEAIRVIAAFGDLLRLALRSDGAHEVPLAREIELAMGYLAIEQVRFDGRLAVAIEVAEEAREANVPHFVLQPLVENAVRHGLDATGLAGGACDVAIRAARRGDMLEIDVEDSGGGARRLDGAGVGLSATRARLAHLYGDAQSLSLTASERGGTRARIAIPFRITPREVRA
jgi:two-component system LytT family sensor kinase